MKRKRRLIIGDVHGCILELESLLENFGFTGESDQLISVGDLVGKGPHSEKVLELFFKNNGFVVRGNHDQAMLNYSRLSPKRLKSHQESYLDSLGPNPQKMAGIY